MMRGDPRFGKERSCKAGTPFRRLLPAALLLLASLSGCIFPKAWRWNQKLTVEVMTPDGVRAGSAITRVNWGAVNSFGNASSSFFGEATVIDLSDGRYLFALMDNHTPFLAMSVFGTDLEEKFATAGKRLTGEERFAAMERFRGTRDLAKQEYPMMVTFDDIHFPETMKLVDPENLSVSFGPGYQLGRVSLTITDEEQTFGRVEEILSCIHGSRVDPSLNSGRTETMRYPNNSPRGYGTVTVGQFIRRPR